MSKKEILEPDFAAPQKLEKKLDEKPLETDNGGVSELEDKIITPEQEGGSFEMTPKMLEVEEILKEKMGISLRDYLQKLTKDGLGKRKISNKIYGDTEVNVGSTIIKDWLEKHNIEHVTKQRLDRATKVAESEGKTLDEFIIDQYNNGKSFHELTRLLGVGQIFVENRAKKLGLKSKTKQNNETFNQKLQELTKGLKTEQEFLREKYWDDKLTLNQIADLTGLTRNVINDRFVKYKIPRRNKADMGTLAWKNNLDKKNLWNHQHKKEVGEKAKQWWEELRKNPDKMESYMTAQIAGMTKYWKKKREKADSEEEETHSTVNKDLIKELDLIPEPTAEELKEEEKREKEKEELNKEFYKSGGLENIELMYSREMSRFPLLTKKEVFELAQAKDKGDERAFKKLVVHNLRLVVSVAKKHTNMGVDFMDLVQEGNMGLITAVDKFKPELGYRFSTYATWWIKQTIIRGLANQSRDVRLPVPQNEKVVKLNQVKKRLTQRLSHEPTREEISQELMLPIEEVERLEKLSQPPLPLAEELRLPKKKDHTEEREKKYVIMTRNEGVETISSSNPFIETLQQANAEKLDKLLSQLSNTEADVLRMRLGLSDYNNPETLLNIGKKYDLTRERIRQIEGEALKKLKKIIKKKGLTLSDFID